MTSVLEMPLLESIDQERDGEDLFLAHNQELNTFLSYTEDGLGRGLIATTAAQEILKLTQALNSKRIQPYRISRVRAVDLARDLNHETPRRMERVDFVFVVNVHFDNDIAPFELLDSIPVS
jgi:hypothetical protein